MTDITSKFWLYAKGLLFLLGGCLAGTLVWLQAPNWRTALLLALCVWCFARCYYFCFYVIEHYIDPGYRFAGLWDFLRYLAGSQRNGSWNGSPGKSPPRD